MSLKYAILHKVHLLMNYGSHIYLRQRKEHRKYALIVAARNQDDVSRESFKGFNRRIGIGRLGVVVIFDAAEFADKFDAVFDALKRLEHVADTVNGRARQKRHHRRGKSILDVVTALYAEFVDGAKFVTGAAEFYDEPIILHECAFRKLTLSAEVNDLARGAINHVAGKCVVVIQHEEIFGGLLRKNFLLHAPINFH